MEKKSTERRRRLVCGSVGTIRKITRFEEFLQSRVAYNSKGSCNRRLSSTWRIHYKFNHVVDRIHINQFFTDRGFDIDEARAIDRRTFISYKKMVKREWLHNNSYDRFEWRRNMQKMQISLAHLLFEEIMIDMVESSNFLEFAYADKTSHIRAYYRMGVYTFPNFSKDKIEQHVNFGIIRTPLVKAKHELVHYVATSMRLKNLIKEQVKNNVIYEDIYVQKRIAANKRYNRPYRHRPKPGTAETTDK